MVPKRRWVEWITEQIEMYFIQRNACLLVVEEKRVEIIKLNVCGVTISWVLFAFLYEITTFS